MKSKYPSPSNNFVAIDIEYADRKMNICQVGIAMVNNFQITGSRIWNIQPPFNYYDDYLSNVHHMTSADTANAPSFEQIWPEIQQYLKGKQIWAHNAISVEQPTIVRNLDNNGFDSDWVDILDSRFLFPREDCQLDSGNGLVQCCMALNIPFDNNNHHDAEYDALKCAEIIIAYSMNKTPDWSNVPKNKEELRKLLQSKRILKLGQFRNYYTSNQSGSEDIFASLSSTDGNMIEQIIDVYDKGDRSKERNNICVDLSQLDTNPNNPLFGKSVMLTGIFDMSRNDIENALALMGAKRVKSITKKTDVIIIGTRNVGYTKLCAIEEQESNGHHIARIVGDADLHALLYGNGQKFFNNIV